MMLKRKYKQTLQMMMQVLMRMMIKVINEGPKNQTDAAEAAEDANAWYKWLVDNNMGAVCWKICDAVPWLDQSDWDAERPVKWRKLVDGRLVTRHN